MKTKRRSFKPGKKYKCLETGRVYRCIKASDVCMPDIKTRFLERFTKVLGYEKIHISHLRVKDFKEISR